LPVSFPHRAFSLPLELLNATFPQPDGRSVRYGVLRAVWHVTEDLGVSRQIADDVVHQSLARRRKTLPAAQPSRVLRDGPARIVWDRLVEAARTSAQLAFKVQRDWRQVSDCLFTSDRTWQRVCAVVRFLKELCPKEVNELHRDRPRAAISRRQHHVSA